MPLCANHYSRYSMEKEGMDMFSATAEETDRQTQSASTAPGSPRPSLTVGLLPALYLMGITPQSPLLQEEHRTKHELGSTSPGQRLRNRRKETGQ